MFLEKLISYSNSISLPAPLYQLTAIGYIIHLDEEGNYLATDEAKNEKGQANLFMETPYCRRAGTSIKPRLLVDTGEYTLGLLREKTDPEQGKKQHDAYKALVRECATETGEASVMAVSRFLECEEKEEKNEEYDTSKNVAFCVDGIYPFNLPSVQQFWAKRGKEEENTASLVECLVCGNQCTPVERLPIVIKGLPGGRPSGIAFISANENAFESYGLTATLTAPTCESCGERFGNALNALLRQRNTHYSLPPLTYIFWIETVRGLKQTVRGLKQQEDQEFNIPELMEAKPEVIEKLYQAWRKGDANSTYVDTSTFNAATLSPRGSGARIALLDWTSTSLRNAVEHLQRYFWLQHLLLPSGEHRYFSLYDLTHATVDINSKKEPDDAVGEALMHLALHGGTLPLSLMHSVIRRVRASHKSPNEKRNTEKVRPEQAALIKMVLLSRLREEGKEEEMATLEEENTNPAYLCGRLLAQLDYIQYRALGKVNATIVDRFYGIASTSPSIVFPRLIKGAEPHLATLRAAEKNSQYSGFAASFSYAEKELTKLLNQFDQFSAFPTMLTSEQQSLFILGFYFQRGKYFTKRANTNEPAVDEPVNKEEEEEEQASHQQLILIEEEN